MHVTCTLSQRVAHAAGERGPATGASAGSAGRWSIRAGWQSSSVRWTGPSRAMPTERHLSSWKCLALGHLGFTWTKCWERFGNESTGNSSGTPSTARSACSPWSHTPWEILPAPPRYAPVWTSLSSPSPATAGGRERSGGAGVTPTCFVTAPRRSRTRCPQAPLRVPARRAPSGSSARPGRARSCGPPRPRNPRTAIRGTPRSRPVAPMSSGRTGWSAATSIVCSREGARTTAPHRGDRRKDPWNR